MFRLLNLKRTERVEAQLLLSFTMSAHLPSPVWDLIELLQSPSLLCHYHAPLFILLSSSLHRVTEHGPNTLLSCLSVSLFFSTGFLPSLSSLSFTPFPFSVFWHFHFSGHCWVLSHPVLFHNFTSFTPTFPVSSNVTSYLSPHSSLLFPFLFFSLSDNDTGKFTPVTLRMELPESCRWMLHGALDWCMRCNTRGLWCMMNTVNDARLGLFSWSRNLLKFFFIFFF